MPSNLYSEAIILFITTSLISIGVATIYFPNESLVRISTMEELEEGYRYGYDVVYLFSEDGYVFFKNVGREMLRLELILIDGDGIENYEVWEGGEWVRNGVIGSGAIFRVVYSSEPKEVVLFIEERFFIRVEVMVP